MYSPVRLARKYLHYYFTAANGKGHGIHSPFVFDFVTSVLNDRDRYPAWAAIEELRRRLRRDGRLLEIEDLGAGSAWNGSGAGSVRVGSRTRSIADIARRAAKPPRLGQLLFRVARYYQPRVVVELGTSLGLSTAYLAAGAPGATVWTIEGSGAIAKTAADNLRGLGLANVEVLTGNFDDLLDPLLDKIGPVELAFVDGNHRREPTLRYFESLIGHAGRSAVLIFDDIHWSREMEQAWGEIRKDPRVFLTIDLFFIGLVVVRDEFKVRQGFTIRF
ncbi:MAG TPA: class I SAM-dependent methyltransferase [Puia sp.]|jgi:predicted O-methyltransferase YrrM|nr:class I SAM-dependent methyltransferase [Puia sp.]